MAETEELGLEVFVEGWQQFERILDKLDKDIDGVDKTASRASSGGLSAFAVAAGTLAANAVMALGRELVKVGGAIVDFTGDSIKMAADFESSMAVLSVAASSAGLSMEDLKAATLAVGGDTRLLGVSATGAAESITGLFKAGLTASEIFGDFNAYLNEGAELGGALRASIDLAAATELDMVQASDLAAIALSAFGGEMETEAERADFINAAMNNMVQAADASVAEVSDLAEALKMVGPTAGSAGIGIEDVNNALALLSTRGISGSMAGTALDGMLRSLRDTTPQAAEEMERLGISVFDLDGEMLPLVDIIGQFEGALGGATDAEKAAALGTIFTAQGQRAMNTLLSEGVEGWDEMATATANAATIQEQAAVRAQTFEAQMESLDGVVETLKIQIGDAFLPVAKELISWFSEMVDEHGPAIQAVFEVIAAAVVDLVRGFMSFIDVISRTGDPLEALGELFTYIFGEDSPQMQSIWSGLDITKATFDEVFGFIQELVGTVVAWFQENLPLINAQGDQMITAWTAIKESFNEIWEIIKTVVSTALEVILETMTLYMQIAQGDWEGAWTTIQEIANTIWEAIQTIVTNFIEGVLNVMGTTTAELIATWRGNWEMAKEIVSGAWAIIQATAVEIWEAIVAFISEKLAALLESMGLNTEEMQTRWSTIMADIRDIAEEIWERIYTFVSEKVEALKDALSPIWDAIKEKVGEIWEAIKGIVEQKGQEVYDAATGIIDDIKEWIAGKVEDFKTIGGDLIMGLKAGVLQKVGDLIRAVTQAIGDALAAARGMLGEHSHSRVFMEIGRQAMQGMIIGIDNMVPQVKATMTAAITPPAVSPTAMAGTQIVNNNEVTDAREFHLHTNTLMQPNQLALEFSTFSMATR